MALKPEFSSDQRSKLLAILIQEAKKGTSMKTAFEIAGVALSKPAIKCKNQWYNRMAVKYSKEVEAARDNAMSQGVQKITLKPDAWLNEDNDKLARLALPYEGRHVPGKWTKIANEFPSRTVKAVANHWDQIKGKYLNKGVDNTLQQVDNTSIQMETALSFNEIIGQLNDFLHNTENRLKEAQVQNQQLLSQNQYLHEENKNLKKNDQEYHEIIVQNKVLQEQLMIAQKNYAQLNGDYQSILKVFDLARKQVVKEELGDVQPTILVMSKNGDLERKQH